MKAITETASILILTLWMLSFLTIFVIGLGYNISGQLRLASHLQDRLKMHYLAKGGIERATAKLDMDETPNYDSLNEECLNNEDFFREIPVGSGYVTVSYQLEKEARDNQETEEVTLYGLMDESSRININKAPLQILKNMLENVGEVETEEAVDIANAIVDWRDADVVVSTGGAEDNYYKKLKLSYPCKNGDFQILEELLLVKGMTPSTFSKITDMITIYGNGKVNINTASWRTLYALGLNSEFAKRIVQFRRGNDEIDGTKDDNVFKTVNEIRDIGHLFTKESEEINRLISLNALAVKSDVFRIKSTGFLKKGTRNLKGNIICVVQRSQGEKSQIVYWHED